MRRCGQAGGMALLVMAIFLAGGGVRPAPVSGGPAPLERGWGRLVASGILAAVTPSAATITLAITGSGRLDAFLGGAVWQQRAVSGTYVIYLLPAALIVDAGDHPLPITALRVKDLAAVWAVTRPDAAILAVSLAIASPRAFAVTAVPSRVERAAEGVVLRRSGSTLDLLTTQGTTRSVVVTASTVIQKNGAPVPDAAVASYDVLKIEGPVNSDGSLVATQIDVEFSAASAAQVSGPVEQTVAGIPGLLVDGTMIVASAEAYIIRNGTRGQLAQITPGRPVTVYGTSIMAGNTPVGLHARVVVAR